MPGGLAAFRVQGLQSAGNRVALSRWRGWLPRQPVLSSLRTKAGTHVNTDTLWDDDEFADKYRHYSWNSQYRFPNEKTKQNQILAEIEDLYEMKEALTNHAKYMSDTIQTIDNVIFGIKYRLDVERASVGK